MGSLPPAHADLSTEEQMHVLDWDNRRERRTVHNDMQVVCRTCGQEVYVDIRRTREGVQEFMDQALPSCEARTLLQQVVR